MEKRRKNLMLLGMLFLLCLVVSRAGAQPFTLNRVADLDTAVPGGLGNFTAIVDLAISGGNVAIIGLGSGGEFGIYLFNGTTLSRVADLNTAVPDGSGNFTNFSPPVISSSNVAFVATGSAGEFGIYLFNGATLTRVADLNTAIPGGVGNFTAFIPPGISTGNVVFVGFDSGGQPGIYSFNGTTLGTVADLNTAIPGGSGNFTFVFFPVVSGGNVAFIGLGSGGEGGIYLFNGTILSKVVDTNTGIPGGSGNFAGFGPPEISGGNVAFAGSGSGGQVGIYLFNGTTLNRIADLNTPIPDGSGNFTDFDLPVISGGNVTFFGSGSGGEAGVYLFNGTTLARVVDLNTPIPGGSGNFIDVGDPLISGSNVAFAGAGSNGQEGVYLALPSPAVSVPTLTGWAMAILNIFLGIGAIHFIRKEIRKLYTYKTYSELGKHFC